MDLARERTAAYDHGAGPGDDEDRPAPSAGASSAPFGLPVLDELPELASALTSIDRADRQLVQAVLTLRPLLAADQVVATSGVGIDHWLAATTRMTGLDRRLLRRMCRLLDRLPALADAAASEKVSFTQLRGLALELHASPRAIDEALDRWLAAAIEALPVDAEPDALVKQAAKAADELAPHVLDDGAERITQHARRLVIQPFLDGTGGTFHGTEDAVGLAVLDAATAPRRDQLDDVGRARADNLQARLRHGCDKTPEVEDEPGASGAEDGAHDRPPTDPLAPPTLLLRWEFDALVDRTATPADLLTRLVGGKLRMTADHARRLIDARGARIRSIIVDEGEVVGVGRATRVPTGWLTDTVLALHDTCTELLCDRPALTADLDHAVEWTPADPTAPRGSTDADNLGPLCGRPNRSRAASGWVPTQTSRGIRTWRHARTGLSLTTLPSTWRPPGAPPAPRTDHRAVPQPGGGHRAPPSARGIERLRYDDPADADRPPPDEPPAPF